MKGAELRSCRAAEHMWHRTVDNVCHRYGDPQKRGIRKEYTWWIEGIGVWN